MAVHPYCHNFNGIYLGHDTVGPEVKTLVVVVNDLAEETFECLRPENLNTEFWLSDFGFLLFISMVFLVVLLI